MSRRLIALCVALSLAGAVPAATVAAAPDAPANWDGLTKFKAKRMDAVYLLPGADFRGYTKVMLDPTEVAFRKNWVRDYNRDALTLDRRISDADAQKILDEARTGFEEIFHKAYTNAGYQVVTEPGPDVVRLRTGVANLYVSAPDVMSAGRSRTYSEDAGSATVIIEVRDSQTGALLGRAVDSRLAGDAAPYIRNSVTNRSDFERLFQQWAKIGVNGLAELKEMSPVPGGS